MRWLFLFVLSLNLAYVGLEMSESSTVTEVNVLALKNVKTIVLLSELKRQQSDAAEDGQQEEVVLADYVSAESSPAEQVVGGDEANAPMPVVSQPVVESKPEVIAEPAEQSNTARNIAETVASAESVASIPKPSVEARPSTSCFTMGPFRKLTELRGLTREIKPYVIKTDFRAREEKERTLYWVYLKPEKNRHQAIETGKRL